MRPQPRQKVRPRAKQQVRPQEKTAHATPGDDTPSSGGGVPAALSSDGVSTSGDDVPAHGDGASAAPGDMKSQSMFMTHMDLYIRPVIAW